MGRLIIFLITAVLIAVFAVQNSTPVHISILFWTLPKVSQALIILSSVLLGAILAYILTWRLHAQHIKAHFTAEKPEEDEKSALQTSSSSPSSEDSDSDEQPPSPSATP
ncbi:MAG: LapA family protein [Firmicutes bacterium]|nr:LapA family protein [Bacillota bacterium]